MKKRYWIIKGLYTVEMVMVQQTWFEYLQEWWHRDENYYNQDSACVGYRYDTSGNLVIDYKRALIRIPSKKFEAEKVELMLFISGYTKLNFNVLVYEALNDFDIRNVTWNTQPQKGNYVTSKYISSSDFSKYITIDITNSFMSWYDRFTHAPSYILIAEHEGATYDILEDGCFETERGVEEWIPKLNIQF